MWTIYDQVTGQKIENEFFNNRIDCTSNCV